MGSSSTNPPEPAPTGAARIPSPLQALLVWVTAAVGILGAGIAVASAAAAVVAARGDNPVTTLGNPATSPLINDPTWIAAGTIANELAVLAALGVWLWVLKTPLSVALPLRRPTLLGVIGALLVVFGLAPSAELMGEMVHRVLANEVTASRIVVNAARGASGGGFALLLLALGVLPALAEEALFRGLITLPFERRFALGMLVPSLLFGLFHLEPTQIAGTIVLGFGFAAGRLCTGTLITPVIVHMVYNTTVVLAVRYSDALVERKLDAVPVVIGLAIALGGGLVLRRERKMLLARHAGSRETMPSWWI